MCQFIREACQEIDNNKNLRVRVCLNVETRLQECVNDEGQQFEYLSDCT
jgi:hypothetical protein